MRDIFHEWRLSGVCTLSWTLWRT
uniref:Uncharacterized protein n=1 Tax=mine drainage metagenome TaxID=410659 RepID=E6PRW8_9ZZZZ